MFVKSYIKTFIKSCIKMFIKSQTQTFYACSHKIQTYKYMFIVWKKIPNSYQAIKQAFRAKT